MDKILLKNLQNSNINHVEYKSKTRSLQTRSTIKRRNRRVVLTPGCDRANQWLWRWEMQQIWVLLSDCEIKRVLSKQLEMFGVLRSGFMSVIGNESGMFKIAFLIWIYWGLFSELILKWTFLLKSRRSVKYHIYITIYYNPDNYFYKMLSTKWTIKVYFDAALFTYKTQNSTLSCSFSPWFYSLKVFILQDIYVSILIKRSFWKT